MRFLFFIIQFSFFSHGFMELDKSTLAVFDLWDNSSVSKAMTKIVSILKCPTHLPLRHGKIVPCLIKNNPHANSGKEIVAYCSFLCIILQIDIICSYIEKIRITIYYGVCIIRVFSAY